MVQFSMENKKNNGYLFVENVKFFIFKNLRKCIYNEVREMYHWRQISLLEKRKQATLGYELLKHGKVARS